MPPAYLKILLVQHIHRLASVEYRPRQCSERQLCVVPAPPEHYVGKRGQSNFSLKKNPYQDFTDPVEPVKPNFDYCAVYVKILKQICPILENK